MTGDEFQELGRRTRNNEDDALVNATLGLTGEAGEVAEHVKKAIFHGRGIDRDHMRDELGDVLFYLAWLADVVDLSLDDVMNRNVEKLRERYPDGFVKR